MFHVLIVCHFSRQPIPNVNAIVKYDIYHDVDHQGGRTLTAPGTWRAVPDFRVSPGQPVLSIAVALYDITII